MSADLRTLLRETARVPDTGPDIDHVWARGRRRRQVRHLGAAVATVATLVVLVVSFDVAGLPGGVSPTGPSTPPADPSTGEATGPAGHLVPGLPTATTSLLVLDAEQVAAADPGRAQRLVSQVLAAGPVSPGAHPTVLDLERIVAVADAAGQDPGDPWRVVVVGTDQDPSAVRDGYVAAGFEPDGDGILDGSDVVEDVLRGLPIVSIRDGRVVLTSSRTALAAYDEGTGPTAATMELLDAASWSWLVRVEDPALTTDPSSCSQARAMATDGARTELLLLAGGEDRLERNPELGLELGDATIDGDVTRYRIEVSGPPAEVVVDQLPDLPRTHGC
jgi:hypothetical protein